MKIGITKQVEVDVKTVTFFAKIRDEGCYTFKDQHGEVVRDIEDEYIPAFFPGEDSDHMELTIELESGKILNWEPPDRQDLMIAINGEDE